MGGIARLPGSLVSHIRSRSNLPDLAQAVEELLSNSIDAGATQVHAFVDLSSLQIKVEDNGSGISREDLTLAGERNATSKLHHLAELEEGVPTLGFRGEALSSLSDVAIVEVISRARGSPNTYRKIMKDCKTLSIGLCSDHRASGTTVILHDVFYNLPVRRKLILSRPKKDLQLVREHALRLALVHPNVSVTVTDVAGGGDLICTHPASSSLSTLCSIFGEDIQSCLEEWNYSKGHFALHGFISKSFHRLPSKAIQFLYINRRFVHKTPVHKFLNNLFGTRDRSINGGGQFKEVDENIKVSTLTSSFKCAFPAFLLNIRSPLSIYDITFEPSKTSVEFKDWESVLSFFKEAVDAGGPKVSLTPVLDEYTELISDVTTNLPRKVLRSKRKSWQRIDPTYCPSCKIDSPGVFRLVDDGPVLSKCQFDDGSYSRSSKSDAEGFKKTKYLPVMNNMESYQGFVLNGDSDLLDFKGQSVTPKSSECLLESTSWLFKETPVATDRFSPCNSQSSRLKMEQFFNSNAFEKCENSASDLVGDTSGFTTSDPTERGHSPLSSLQNSFDLCSSFSPPICSTMLGFGSDQHYFNKRRHNDLLFSPAANISKWNDFSDFSEMPNKLLKRSRDNFPLEYTSPPVRIVQSNEMRHVRRCLDRDGFVGCADDSLVCAQNNFTPGEKKEKVDSELNGTTMLTADVPDNSDMTSKKEHICFSPTHLTFSNSDILFESTSQDTTFEKVYMRRKKRHEHHISSSSMNEVKKTMKNLGNDDLGHFLDPVKLPPIDLDVLALLPRTTRTCNFLDRDASRSSYERDTGVRDEKDLYQDNNLMFLRRKKRLRRSLSAPPFYKPRKKYGLPITSKYGLSDTSIQNTLRNDQMHPVQSCMEMENQKAKALVKDRGKGIMLKSSCNSSKAVVAFRGFDGVGSLQEEKQDSLAHQEKTGDTSLKTTVAELYQEWINPCLTLNERYILDISSGVVGPNNKYLLPESISKESLKEAQVLKQIGKKFIAVVAGNTLIMVDQHAADERIRLEQLREHVLANKKQLSTLLNCPQEVSIMFGDQQLLQTYRPQIEDWGWRFKILPELRKRKGQAQQGASSVLLTAVPCILGESLEDENILGEYLRQLAATGGSSSPPPAVLRLLATKACRGAIMFGDPLLQSECRQLIDGLKQTALCFQCAHGRPTSVPIVNLHALHKRLEMKSLYGSENVDRRDTCYQSDNNSMFCWKGQWHGLQCHKATLERARERLKQAEKM